MIYSKNKEKWINYFNEYVTNEKNRIIKFSEFREKCTTDEQAQKCDLFLFHLYKNIIYCKCSLKQCNIEFDDEFNETIKKYLALSTNLKTILADYDVIDSLAINYLFGSKSDDAFDTFFCELSKLTKYEVYNNIYKISQGENAAKNLATYMNTKWYDNCFEFPWYNAHTSNNKTYVGYFSFTASAIAKKQNIDINDIKFLIY